MIRIMDGSDERHVGLLLDGHAADDGAEDVSAIVATANYFAELKEAADE